ncbi:MAG TPA: penicillin-binding transpeptidase domain-containing protein, partial [Methylophilaceae bacterium]|nr:penicillin-binding transpeptidase domain-containing protein [Methylophilaceae bacterium]
GFVAIDPSNGYLKAWVGSRGYMEDKFDHVIQARRQPGSTFKPLVYAAALEQGMSPRKRFTDYAVEIPLRDGTVWRPRDASAPTGEKMTAREGLVYSKNTITAQVMQEVGPDKTVALAQKAGISDSKLEAVPSLALGASPVTLFEMAAAYSTIAAVGVYHPPILVRKITDRYGNVLASFEVQSTRVMPEESTKELIDMLRGVVDEGTGHGIRTRFGITADVAGKTGTTQNNTDGWFMLMHPKLVAGSWVGFNDARITMRSNYWGQGAQTALPVVGDFFRQTLNARLINASAQFPRPPRTLMDSIRDTVDEIFNLKW